MSYSKNPSAYHNFLSKGEKPKSGNERRNDEHNRLVAGLAARRLEEAGGDKRKAAAKGKAVLPPAPNERDPVYALMKGSMHDIVERGTALALKEIKDIGGPLLQRLNDIGGSGVTAIKGVAERRLVKQLKRKSLDSVLSEPLFPTGQLDLSRFGEGIAATPAYQAIVEKQGKKSREVRAIADEEQKKASDIKDEEERNRELEKIAEKRKEALGEIGKETQRLIREAFPIKGDKGDSSFWKKHFSEMCVNTFAGLFLYALEHMPDDEVKRHASGEGGSAVAPTLEALASGSSFTWLKKPAPAAEKAKTREQAREEELAAALEKQREIRGQVEKERKAKEEVDNFRENGGKVPLSILERLVDQWGGRLG